MMVIVTLIVIVIFIVLIIVIVIVIVAPSLTCLTLTCLTLTLDISLNFMVLFSLCWIMTLINLIRADCIVTVAFQESIVIFIVINPTWFDEHA